MSCQTGDYNFSSYGTWRPSGFRTEGKMGTQTFSIVSENRKKNSKRQTWPKRQHLLRYILQTEHNYINTDFVWDIWLSTLFILNLPHIISFFFLKVLENLARWQFKTNWILPNKKCQKVYRCADKSSKSHTYQSIVAKEQNLIIRKPFACKHPNQKSKFWF